MGSARDHRSPEHRTRRSLQGALRCGRAGGEEARGGRNGVRLPYLACFLEGVWERWAAGEAAASPPCPPPLPPRWQPEKPEARAGAMPGGGVPGPPRPAAANPDGAHVLVMAGLASRQQPRGRGGCHGRIQSWSVSMRVPGMLPLSVLG